MIQQDPFERIAAVGSQADRRVPVRAEHHEALTAEFATTRPEVDRVENVVYATTASTGHGSALASASPELQDSSGMEDPDPSLASMIEAARHVARLGGIE